MFKFELHYHKRREDNTSQYNTLNKQVSKQTFLSFGGAGTSVAKSSISSGLFSSSSLKISSCSQSSPTTNAEIQKTVNTILYCDYISLYNNLSMDKRNAYPSHYHQPHHLSHHLHLHLHHHHLLSSVYAYFS